MKSSRERILTVLKGQKPDKVPFCIFADLLPQGSFERMFRNKGLGLLVNVGPAIQEPRSLSETPHVGITFKKSARGQHIIYQTPVGDISHEVCVGSMRTSSLDWKVPATSLIKDVQDYQPLIYMVDDTVFHLDCNVFGLMDEDLGDDGILHMIAGLPPYVESQYMLGLTHWSYERHDHPAQFASLLEALERRNDRYMAKLAQMDAFQMVYLGDMSDNLGPQDYEQYMLPYFQKYAALFRDAGKKCGIHIHAKLLKRQKEVLKKMAPDFLESYTPPPYSDLSLPQLRETVGDEVVILINCPETVFYQGYQRTKQYIKSLLQSDPSPKKMIGFTEMGMMGVKNGYTREAFQNGFRAVYDAIQEAPYAS